MTSRSKVSSTYQPVGSVVKKSSGSPLKKSPKKKTLKKTTSLVSNQETDSQYEEHSMGVSDL